MAVWLNDYLNEFSQFTPLLNHKHDDQIDATLDAVNILLRPNKNQAGVW